MTSSLINPEVLDQDTSLLEDSPMTESEEKELLIEEAAIAAAYAGKLERNLAIGKSLYRIFKRKLYRGKDGTRKWDDWLAERSSRLTLGTTIDRKTAQRLRTFYRFREEILPSRPEQASGKSLPLPTNHYQVDSLIGQVESCPEAAIAMWKAAVTDANGKVPTASQVQRAALAYKANEENEARRLSAGQQSRLESANQGARAAAAARSSEPSREYFSEPQRSAPATAPSIPAWEIQKDDSSIDAGAECKRITQAINEAHKSIGLLRGILYSQINTYGRDYLGFLRQVDAGVYSLHNIDDQVQQMGEDIDFISDLLIADVGEGDLAASTVEVSAFPTKE